MAHINTEESKKNDLFLSSLDHDLRAPMVSIQGFLELLLAGRFGEIPPDAQSLLKRAYQDSFKVSFHSQHILHYLSLFKAPSPMIPCDISKSIEKAQKKLRKAYGKKSERIQWKSKAESIPSIPFHPPFFEQILFQILEFSIRFSPEICPIFIFAQNSKKYIEISIVDGGIPFTIKKEGSKNEIPEDYPGLFMAKKFLNAYQIELSLEKPVGFMKDDFFPDREECMRFFFKIPKA